VKLTDEQRRVLDLHARLANVIDPSTLRPSERLAFEEDLADLGLHLADRPVDLFEAHALAQRLVSMFLDGSLVLRVFRRCKICRDIFVIGGKRIYCGPACMYRAAEAGRLDPDRRKAQKREYMRKRRAAAAKPRKGRQREKTG
jgi:hypothetical protein